MSDREFGSLQEALTWAEAGMRLDVGSGVYDEDLEITRPVTLVGEPGAVLAGAVSLRSGEASLVGLELRGHELRVGPGAACTLERCRLEGAALRSEAGSVTTVTSCRLTENLKLAGTITLRQSTLLGTLLVITSPALIEDCQLLGGFSALAGWGAKLTVRRCLVRGDRQAGPARGALFLHLSTGEVEDTRFEGGGVEVHGGRIVMRRCQIVDQLVGLRLDTSESNTLEHCELLGSRQSSVLVGSGAGLYLWGCRIGESQEGVRNQVNGRALLANCELFELGGPALWSEGRVRARHCLLRANGTGLGVGRGGKLEADHCVLVANQRDYAVEEDGELELQECGSEAVPLPESARRPTEDELEELLASGRRNLAGRTLEFLRLHDLDMRGVDLDGAVLRDTHFVRVNLTGARLRGADLRGAFLSDSVLDGADLEGANLTGAGIHDCSLKAASLKNADLSDATLSLSRRTAPRELSGARLVRAHLRGSFERAQFVGVEASAARFERCALRGSDFTGARLRKAALGGNRAERADLSEACFQSSDLGLADLSHAVLRGANFRDANLGSANLSYSDASGACFEGARLGSVYWLHTRLEGATFSEDHARLVREHLERVHAQQERAAEEARQKELERSERHRREREQLALSTFGEQARPHLKRAGRLQGISLVQDFGLPERLLERAAALVAQERPIAERCSAALVGLEHYARRPEQPVPAPESDLWYRSLYEFGRQLYPQEMEWEQNGESQFRSADAMRRYRLEITPNRLEPWTRKYLFERSEKESGLEPAVRLRTLRAWLDCLRPILFAGDEAVPAYGLTDEDDGNTEYGVYLLLGHRCAVVVRRHWHL